MGPASISGKTFILAGILCYIQVPEVACAASSQVVDMESYFRVIWGLLVVLAVILALYGLFRKRFSLLAGSPEKNIKILEIKPLMGKKALCLITVKGTEYLLGISGDQINHLATLSTKPELSFAETLRSTETDRQP